MYVGNKRTERITFAAFASGLHIGTVGATFTGGSARTPLLPRGVGPTLAPWKNETRLSSFLEGYAIEKYPWHKIFSLLLVQLFYLSKRWKARSYYERRITLETRPELVFHFYKLLGKIGGCRSPTPQSLNLDAPSPLNSLPRNPGSVTVRMSSAQLCCQIELVKLTIAAFTSCVCHFYQ